MVASSTSQAEPEWSLEKQRPISGISTASGPDAPHENDEHADQAVPAADANQAEQPQSRLAKWSLAALTFALCVCVFMVGLDNTIIATAIPKITDEFHSITDVGWYASAYLLTTCAFQLFFGKLYSMTPVKWTFVGCICVFEFGSLICALAVNSVMLIVGRAIAGIGASGMYSGAMLCVAHAVPLRQRAAYIGGVASMWGVSSVVGPLLGGAFTDRLTWRWCFWINLPLGAAALLIVIFLWRPKKIAIERHSFWQLLARLDLPGSALFIPGIVCVLLALQWGGATYPWDSWRIILLLVLFGVLMLAFAAWQYSQGARATIPLAILRRRAIWSATIYSALLGGSFYSVVYFVSIWFQAVKGVSATQSGIDTIPLVLSTIVISAAAGIFTTLVGWYTQFFYLGAVCGAVGAGLMTMFRPDTPPPTWIGLQVLFGGGSGFGLQQAIIAVQAHVSLAEVPIAVALVLFGLNFGGSLFVSVAQALFTNQIVGRVSALFPGVDVAGLLSSGATKVSASLQGVPPDVAAQIIDAYNQSLVYGPFVVAAALAAAAMVPALFQPWTSVKGRALDMLAG